MAVITKTFTENTTSALASTWSLSLTGTNATASGSVVDISIPILKVKYTATGKNRGRVKLTCNLRNGTTNLLRTPITYEKERVATNYLTPMTSGTEYVTDTNYLSTVVAVPISSLFSESNPNDRTVNINAIMTSTVLASGLLSSDSGTAALYNSYSSSTASAWGNILSVTLNAPPTFETTQVSFDIDYVYAGLTTASITVSDAVAYYGGNINEVKLTIGSQSITRQDAGTLSILLNTEGEFTPVVTVTDSRGQTTSTSLNKIYVNGYLSPSIDFNDLDRVLGTYKLTEDNEVVANKAYYSRTGTGSTAHPFVYTLEHPVTPANPHTLGYYEETNAKGVGDDEGTSAVIDVIPVFTREIAYLEEPILQVDGETSISSNPPIMWYTDRALTSAVNWTEYKPAEGTHLYGYIADIFDTQQSYQIGLIPYDSIGSGTLKTQMLTTAFYTVDFLAGGHGIAFGQPCHDEGFYCNMDAYFRDTVGIMRAMFNLMHPIGSYYETSLPTTPISGHSFENKNLTDEEIADCGIDWFDPRVMWGGQWALEIAGMVHVSAGTGYSVNHANDNDGVGTKDGGEATHTLTKNEMPTHNHTQTAHTHTPATTTRHFPEITTVSGSSGTYQVASGTGRYTWASTRGYQDVGTSNKTASAQPAIQDTGGGAAHNNMQPYIVVYRWHRYA